MKNRRNLNQMIRLCELREHRIKRSLAEQQVLVAQAESGRAENAATVERLEQEKVELDRFEKSGGLHTLNESQVARRWLKYDDEKARYFLNKSENELLQQSEVATELNTRWIRIRDKHSRYSSLLKKVR